MRYYISYLLSLVTVFTLASCGQALGPAEEGTFTLTVEATRPVIPVTKALDITANGMKSTWDVGDVISVTKWDRVIGTLSPQTNEPSTAGFSRFAFPWLSVR